MRLHKLNENTFVNIDNICTVVILMEGTTDRYLEMTFVGGASLRFDSAALDVRGQLNAILDVLSPGTHSMPPPEPIPGPTSSTPPNRGP